MIIILMKMILTLLFLSDFWHSKLEKCKELKKMISEELMPIA